MYYSGSGNTINSDYVMDNSSLWDIYMEDGCFKINNVMYTDRYIQWNSLSPRFACYRNTVDDIELYLVVAK